MKEWEEVECFREVEITQEIKRTRTKEEKKSERGARPQCMDADEFGSMPPCPSIRPPGSACRLGGGCSVISAVL